MAKLEKYAQKTTDNELLGKIRIVKTYDQILPACMSKIREKTVRDLTQAGAHFQILFFFSFECSGDLMPLKCKFLHQIEHASTTVYAYVCV